MVEILKFEKNGCMPCRIEDNVLNQFDTPITRIHLENDGRERFDEYQVQSTPTLIKLVDGVEDSRKSGLQTFGQLKGWM